MKKNIYIYLSMLLGICTFSSCTEEPGTEPGNDTTPSAIVYQYQVTPEDGDYDADTDVHIRIAANSATSEVYYLAESTASQEAFVEANGIEAYRQHVATNGQKAALTDGIADVILTGLLNANTITVVAKGNNGTLTSQATSFFGIIWKDICTGKIKAPLLDGTLNYTWGNEDLVLQQREDKPSELRIKNAYGKGYNINLTKDSKVYSEGEEDFFEMPNAKFSFIRMTTSPTPYTYGNYGTVSLADAGDDNASYCRIYENNFIGIYSAATVSAGRLTDYAFFYFSPNE